MRNQTLTIGLQQIGPFQIEFAAGLGGRDDEFRLRHQVFVTERRYLEGQADTVHEVDEFDAHAAAFVLRDVATGEAAACQRFIMPDRLPQPMPTQVERLATKMALPFAPPARDAWAEVSRTTIAPKYRWGGALATMPAMRAITYASLALARALGRHTLFSISDRRTAILLRHRMGFAAHQVGEEFDYHGRRVLFRIDMTDVARSVSPDLDACVAQLTVHARASLAT